ncbi:hypothetical protein CEW87_10620 [Parazoarcus communis]|uniref:Uncharacterized protein n=2 Tax=Parazoarcus communis TaxID=41977 RepID=A0A2U8H1G6_9RHOO|nr:hypothetical protein CEW87_10620 [Parazoarcus communis]
MNPGKRVAATGQGLAVRSAWGGLAMAALVALGLFAVTHPLGLLVGLAFALVLLALMSVRRDAWLVFVPALLPVADLAGWTGAIHFTESDALVLSALAVGGLREATKPSVLPRGGVWRFGVVQYALLGLMSISYALSTAWQPLLAVASDPGLLAGYSTPLNGLRLTKGFVWALLFLPLLAFALRARPEQATRALVAGMLLGLVLVSLAAVWERMVFTGLTDFASDYRTTALFWEMNVGGATLDGWLALTVPFALWAVLQVRDRAQLPLLLAVLLLAGYVCFTTFSRGLYLGLAFGAVVTALQTARHTAQHGGARVSVLVMLAWGAFLLPVGWLLAGVFQTGGYRGLGAMLGVALAVFAVAPVVASLPRRSLGHAALIALLGVTVSVAAMWWIPKGVYLAYGLSGVCLLWMLRAEPVGRLLALAGGLAVACLLWLVANAVLVTLYWSEGQGLWPALLAAGALLLPLGMVRGRPAACWRPTVQAWVVVLLVLGCLATVVVTFNSYYASKRFETVSEDLVGRLKHWALSASLPQSAEEQWLGVGVGQFAERYFWRVPDGMYPGSHHIVDEGGNRFLRMGGPRHTLGFGELYRASQRVSPGLAAPLMLSLRARALNGDGRLHVEVCRKHLLYTHECTGEDLKVPVGPDWHRLDLALDGERLGGRGSWLPRMTVFSVANAGRGRVVEVDDISMFDAQGLSLLDNGDFSAASNFWFFSSDRHHLPWHAKNLWLHYLVEQGVLGAVAFSLLCLAAFYRVTVGQASMHVLAPPVAGALAGFFAVGAFDSLLDAPRLTLLAFLMMFLALGLRRARHIGPST